MTATGGPQIVSVIGRFLTKSLHRSPHVIHVRTKQIQIEADPPMPVQLDGDVLGLTPARWDIAAQGSVSRSGREREFGKDS